MKTRIKYIKKEKMGGVMLFRLKSGYFGRRLRHMPLLKVPKDS